MLDNVATISGREYINVVESIINPLANFEAQCDQLESKKRIYKRKIDSTKTVYIPLYIITPIISFILFLSFNIKPIIFFIIPKLILLAVPAISFGLVYIYYEPRSKKKIIELQNECDEVCGKMQEEIQIMGKSFYNVLHDYVPVKYQYSYALSNICGYLDQGRASNLKEAMNLFEEEMHRKRIEDMQAQMVKQAKYQTALSAISAVANVSTAISASSAASSLSSIDAKLDYY